MSKADLLDALRNQVWSAAFVARYREYTTPNIGAAVEYADKVTMDLIIHWQATAGISIEVGEQIRHMANTIHLIYHSEPENSERPWTECSKSFCKDAKAALDHDAHTKLIWGQAKLVEVILDEKSEEWHYQCVKCGNHLGHIPICKPCSKEMAFQKPESEGKVERQYYCANCGDALREGDIPTSIHGTLPVCIACAKVILQYVKKYPNG